ncbi:MAG: zf-HC2 domain-containing protein [Tepidanaerobacteraceae bacterium]|nr:zf-HC2 domain-containing protein [Tepidanaerobacteraceae bacterium]
MSISCDVIQDLIPLVKDGVASAASTRIVNEHIAICERCRTEFEIFQTNLEQPSIKDEKIIFAIKRSILITQFVILIAGAIIGVALSNSMCMFYNFIIMPAIGGISMIALKRKWYLAPFGIFIITFLWLTIKNIVLSGFARGALYDGLYYSTIYTVLVGLGLIIAMLLKFIFAKDGE